MNKSRSFQCSTICAKLQNVWPNFTDTRTFLNRQTVSSKFTVLKWKTNGIQFMCDRLWTTSPMQELCATAVPIPDAQDKNWWPSVSVSLFCIFKIRNQRTTSASMFHVLAVMWENSPIKIRMTELGLKDETCAHFKRIGLSKVNSRGGVFYELVADLRVSQNRYVDIL